jgi:hypothetical protein
MATRSSGQRRADRSRTESDELPTIETLHEQMQRLQTQLRDSTPKPNKTKFREHSAKYAGKTQLEYRAWATSLERDHEYYPETFDRDEDKVYHAQSTIVAGSKASKRWSVILPTIDNATYTWQQFKDEMLGVLGSQETRSQTTVAAWFQVTWEKDPNTMLATLESLESLMAEPVPEELKLGVVRQKLPKSLAERVLQTG